MTSIARLAALPPAYAAVEADYAGAAASTQPSLSLELNRSRALDDGREKLQEVHDKMQEVRDKIQKEQYKMESLLEQLAAQSDTNWFGRWLTGDDSGAADANKQTASGLARYDAQVHHGPFPPDD